MSRALASSRVLIDGAVGPATIIFSIESGRILHIAPDILSDDLLLRLYNVLPQDYRNVSPHVVMPGIVDAHVHLNEPGRTEWEGFETGTKAAASGGVTTVVDMPLNAVPPTTTVANFNLKINAARGQTWVDVGFWGGMVPDNLDHLQPLISMGVRGFKGFLIDSGVDEFPAITPRYISKAMRRVQGKKTVLMFHAEMQTDVHHRPPVAVEETANSPPRLVAQASFHFPDSDSDNDGENSLSSAVGSPARQKLALSRDTSFSSAIMSKQGSFAVSKDSSFADVHVADLGMSESFIQHAPRPVLKLLSLHRPEPEPKTARLHSDDTFLTAEQVKALAKSPYLAASEPQFGRNAHLAHHNHHRLQQRGPAQFEKPFDFDKSILETIEGDTEYTIDDPLALAQEDDSRLQDVDATTYAAFLASRPDTFETTAIAEIISCLTKNPTVPLHIVHLATHEAIPLITAAKAHNLPVTAETCFHYLSLTAEKISNCHTHFKCCPPIRTDDNRKLLWKALRAGIISTVVSDHSPCTPDLKGLEKGDFFLAWGGISSVGFGLPILFTEGSRLDPPVSLAEISEWCSWNTAKQVGLSHKKGKIAPGYDADLLVFDTEAEYVVQNDQTYFKNKLTAYDGMMFNGRVVETLVRGNSVFAYGKGHSDLPMGGLILEPRTT